MKIQLVSDLHIEYNDVDDILDDMMKGHDVHDTTLVVAGDLAPLADASNPDILIRVNRFFGAVCGAYRHVVYTFGNHEYYGASSWEAVRTNVLELQKGRPNLHHLDNSLVVLDGYRFIGGTMWYRPIRDHYTIPGMWNPVFGENRAFDLFMKGNLRRGDVVVTHHMPSRQCVSPAYVNSPTNGFFVCAQDHLIEDRGPVAWFYGHTHTGRDAPHEDARVGCEHTRLVCNPRGYPGENPRFDPQLLLELSRDENGRVRISG